jgi:hypothetical protein
MTPAKGSMTRSRGRNTMLIQMCFMYVRLMAQGVRRKVNMYTVHVESDFV